MTLMHLELIFRLSGLKLGLLDPLWGSLGSILEHLGASGPRFWVPGGAEIDVFCNFVGIVKTLKKTIGFYRFLGVSGRS